jgi:tetratricopeptide (TPR) repeat protein
MLKTGFSRRVDDCMDLLDFEASGLYFEQGLGAEAQACIEQAAQSYGAPDSEQRLLRGYFLEPQHPMVLVALYRFYYYQHRYDDALIVAERVLRLFAQRLDLPDDWRELDVASIAADTRMPMTDLRFYLLALKGAGYLELRLQRYGSAIERLRKIVDLDEKDRLGVASLLQMAEDEIDRQSGIYRLRF